MKLLTNGLLEVGENPTLCRNGKTIRHPFGVSYRAGKMKYILSGYLPEKMGKSPIQQKVIITRRNFKEIFAGKGSRAGEILRHDQVF